MMSVAKITHSLGEKRHVAWEFGLDMIGAVSDIPLLPGRYLRSRLGKRSFSSTVLHSDERELEPDRSQGFYRSFRTYIEDSPGWFRRC